jgi:hypothetical protein
MCHPRTAPAHVGDRRAGGYVTSSMEQTKGPSAAGYWIGGAVALLTVSVMVVLLVVLILDALSSSSFGKMTRFDVPGEHIVHVPQSGSLHVFLSGSDPKHEGWRVTVVGSDGERVHVAKPGYDESYTGDEMQNTLLATAHVPRGGDYDVSITGADYSNRIAHVGLVDVQGLVLDGIGIAAVGIVGFPIAILLFVVTAMRRGGYRKRVAMAAAQPQPWYPPPPGM